MATAASYPTIKMGDRGQAVSDLQEALGAVGFFKGTIDGIFGAETKIAVVAFQRSRGLTADGIAGPATWASLFNQAGPPSKTIPPKPSPPIVIDPIQVSVSSNSDTDYGWMVWAAAGALGLWWFKRRS